MITHESDSQLLKMYCSVLTDHAIKQVRDAYKCVSKIHENITIEENDDNTFDFINDNFHVTVSFNHNDQMLCNCPIYLQHQFFCPHMLVILEEKILPSLLEEKDISELLAMKELYKKQSVETVIEQASQFATQEPIIFQSSRPAQKTASSRYNQLHSVFQRLSARADQVGENEFNKILESLTQITEMAYSNKTDVFHSALIVPDQFQDDSYELPDLNLNQEQAFIHTSPTTSAAPFKITPCKFPVGRAKGGAQAATSFKKKVTFKRSKQSVTYQIGAKIAKTASNIQRKVIEIVTSESTTTTTQFIGSDTDDTELDEESFTSIISKIDEEPVASKPVLASTSASFKTPTKRSARLAKQSK